MPQEAEDALLDPRRVGAAAYSVAAERRSAVIGATQAGRVLFVVYTWRGRKVRIVTARDADQAQRRRYRR